MYKIRDAEFSNAVWAAANGHPAPLSEWLRSDRPLGPGEREFLAELIEGELKRPRGKPAFGAGHTRVVEAVAHYRELIAAGELQKRALGAAADRAKVNESTVRRWRAMVEEREEAIVALPSR